MSFSVTSKTARISFCEPKQIITQEKHIQVALKVDQLALIALVLAQSSGLVISYLFPEKSYLVQLGTLTLTLSLFLRLNAQKKMSRIPIENSEIEIHNPTYKIFEKMAPARIIEAPAYMMERQYPLSLDEKIDNVLYELGQNIYRCCFWKIIPHPTLFKK